MFKKVKNGFSTKEKTANNVKFSAPIRKWSLNHGKFTGKNPISKTKCRVHGFLIFLCLKFFRFHNANFYRVKT